MRHIFKAQDTTPTPDCKKAIEAYRNYCNGPLNKSRIDVCNKQQEWFDAKGTGGSKALQKVQDELKALEKIIAGPAGKAKKEAKAAKAKIPNLAILEALAVLDKTKADKLKERDKLGDAIKKENKTNPCNTPINCLGANDSCKKIGASNEERKNKRKSKNKRKNKMKNKPKNERKNKMKNKPKNERKNKVKNKPKNEKKNEKKTERKAERKAARKTERKAVRKTERKALRKTESEE